MFSNHNDQDNRQTGKSDRASNRALSSKARRRASSTRHLQANSQNDESGVVKSKQSAVPSQVQAALEQEEQFEEKEQAVVAQPKRGSVNRRATGLGMVSRPSVAMQAQLQRKLTQTVLGKDDNLPYPPNIRDFTATQLAYLYNREGVADLDREILLNTAFEMIEQLSRLQVVTQEHLTDVVPLATFKNQEVIKELLRIMVEKVRDEAFIDEKKLSAIALIIYYADSQLLKANDVLESIVIIAQKLAGMKTSAPEIIIAGLQSLNILLDAAMTLEVDDIDGEKIAEVTAFFDELEADDPIREVEIAYAKQALLRVSQTPTDWETGLGASYELVNGVIALGFAVLDKSPTDIIDSILVIYDSATTLSGLMSESKDSWFGHVRTMKLLADQDFRKCLDYLRELTEQSQQENTGRFGRSSSAMPRELTISLIQTLDNIIRNKDNTRTVNDSIHGVMRLMLVRESAIRLFESLYTNTAVYGAHEDVRQLLLQKLYQYCSLPEQELQRVAKDIAQGVYLFKEDTRRITNLFNKREHLPSQFWGNDTVILNQAGDANFPYEETPGIPQTDRVSLAFERRFPVEYLIEGMRRQIHDLSRTVLKKDMDTYIPVNGSVSATKKEMFDLYQAVQTFLASEEERALLVHGNAGSGKSLFGRYLQLSIWQQYSHSAGVIPVFITLPALKNPTRGAIEQTFKEAGFTEAQINQLRVSGRPFLFLLDGFDEIQTKVNLYQSNQFSQWNCKVIITARTEYLLGLGDYQGYFKENETDAEVKEYFIRPFDNTQRQSFFQKMIDMDMSEWQTVQQYEEAITSIQGLDKLISTPFMLRIVTEVLPTLVQEQDEDSAITRAVVYQAFTEVEFQRSRERLHQIASQPNSSLQIPPDFDELNSFRTYSMMLATNMFVLGENSVMTKGSDYRFDEDVEYFWDKFFGNHDPSLIASRMGAPLVGVGRQRSFRHKSLLEYFTAKMLVRELRISATANHIDSSRYLNRRPIHEEPSILRFMIDMINEEPEIEAYLWQLIEQSKQDPGIAIATGNAFTLLVAMEKSFEEKDLSETHSKGAVMDNGNFRKADFRRAHFEDTSWDGACLDEADFREAHFNNNLIEERAALDGLKSIVNDCFVLDNYNITIATTSGGVCIWYEGKLIDTLVEAMFTQCFVSDNHRFVMLIAGDKGWLYDVEKRQVVKEVEALQEAPSVVAFNETECLLAKSEGRLKRLLLEGECNEIPVDINFGMSEGDQLKTVYCAHFVAPRGQWLINYQPQRRWKKALLFDSNNLHQGKVEPYLKSPNVFYLNAWPLGSTPYAMVLVDTQELQFVSLDTLKAQIDSVLASARVDMICISSSGRMVITKKNQQAIVYSFQTDPEPTFQELYRIDGVTSSLTKDQFSPDERYIVWGIDNIIQITKAQELVRVQMVALPQKKAVKKVVFSDQGQGLTLMQDVSLVLQRIRVNINEQLEEELQESVPGSGELSAFGANFIEATGLSPEDTALMHERGGIFETEEVLTERYQSSESEEDKRLILVRALRYRYRTFLAENEWDKDLRLEGGGTLAHYLVEQQRHDAGYNDYLGHLAESGVSLKEQDERGRTTLFIAAQEGHKSTCAFLIGSGVEVNKDNSDGVTPLIAAAQKEHQEVCSLLLNNGAEVNQEANNGVTPLYVAAENGYVQLCVLLLEHEAQVNQLTSDGATPLYVAAKNGYVETCKLLLKHEAQVNQANEYGVSPLYIAASNGHVGVCRLLLAENAEVNQANNKGATPLYVAALNGCEEVCVLLLECGAQVNQANNLGTPPLYMAASNGHVEVCRLLINKNAEVNLGTNKGVTPLYVAAMKGQIEVCRLLLKRGAQVNQVINNGRSPLYIAAENGRTEICTLLLENGAEVNQMNNNSEAPLYIAAKNGHAEACALLLDRGADASIINNKDKTALDIVRENNRTEIVTLIEAKLAEQQTDTTEVATTVSDQPSALFNGTGDATTTSSSADETREAAATIT